MTPGGALYCWGYNANGQMGDGTTTGRMTPGMTGSDYDWILAGLGDWHTCAIKTTKSLFCWGLNSSGQVGDGTTTDRLTPLRIP